MREKKFDKNKSAGITLIALVVTIIVLLILAGISVQMLTGNNGVLQKAGESKETSRNAQIYEELQLGINSLGIDYYRDISNNSTISFGTYVLSNKALLAKELGVEASELTIDRMEGIITYRGEMFDITSDGSINKVKTIDLTATGGYVEAASYPVTYTDVFTSYEFGKTTEGVQANDAWRVLYRTKNASDSNKWDVKIISTGIPAKVNYTNDTTNTPSTSSREVNGWWGEEKDVENMFHVNYKENDYPAIYVAAGLGLYKNFKLIPFERVNTPALNKGGYKTINGKQTGTLYGDEFIAKDNAGTKNKYINTEVHNLTFRELNEARGKAENPSATTGINPNSNGIEGAIGMFHLSGLATNYGYTTSTNYSYWLARPNASEYVRFVYYAGYISHGISKASCGIRPVVSIEGVTMQETSTGSEIWTITQ